MAIINGSADITCAASITASGMVIVFATADISASAIVTAESQFTKIYASASITANAAVTCSAYKILSTIADAKARSFRYEGKQYFLDGTNFLVHSGGAVTTVVGKIPTITIATAPNGGGTLFEAINYISPSYTQSFSGNGTATVFQLALSGLDATLVTATVDGVVKTEITDFTVNRTLGTVTFTTAPPATEPDNVPITFHKTYTGRKDEIFKCTIPYVWGGADGNRIWLTGNPNFANRDYGSGLEDPTYWPVTQYDNVGNTDDPIKGYSELYGSLIIVKRKSLFARNYETDASGNPTFPTKRLNGSIGTEATESIQILDTFPTFLTSKGVYQVTSIDPTQENNVRHISDDIDKNVNLIATQGLLEMDELSQYVSIDFNSKYWLFNPVNGKVWVYDYRYIVNNIGQWFLLDNLYANCLLEIDANLYIGDSRKGLINRFLTKLDNDMFSDIEESTLTAINAYWTSKINSYNLSTNLKLVSKVFFDLKPAKRSSTILSVRSDLKSVWNQVKEVFVSLFAYSLLTYSTFTYGGSEFPRQTRAKVKAKKVGYYQIKLSNNRKSESLGILNVATKILGQREVK